jgi:hypothetical protein
MLKNKANLVASYDLLAKDNKLISSASFCSF